jgi:hypothetical protein
MSRSDSQPPESRDAEPDISFLPEVVAVKSALRRYRKPRLRARGREVVEVEEAVEITVTTAAPFPERALGPVLLIGRAQVTESERLAADRYRFYAYEFDKLKQGAPIRLGWFGQPRPVRQTGFRFVLARNRRPGRPGAE